MGIFGDFKRRHRQPELMDEPDIDAARHVHALCGLERINRVSRSAAILWPAIRALALPGQPLRLLDVASGAGDVTLALWQRAQRAGIRLEAVGLDRSARAVDFAANRARERQASVRFLHADALAQELPQGLEVVTSSLFLHHLSDEEAEALLRRMAAAARRLVLVNDLRRSRSGYALAWAGTRLLSRSPVVHTDGPLSVQAAFTCAEIGQLAERAGLAGSSVQPRWPCRLLLSWSRT